MSRILRIAKRFSSMTHSPPKAPLIAVIGATGCGKSQLAVTLAKRYNGEIINGDAMQLYSGLPIITNKITVEEQQGIPHHLLGCIGLDEQTWVVGVFVKRALDVIADIRNRGKLPILVGGTHYYTQSLLFNDRLVNDDAGLDQTEAFVEDTSAKWPILKEPTEILLAELKRVDPAMADRWHPNDRRKIQRSLEIYLQSGKKASDIYAEQRMRQRVSNGTDSLSSLSEGPALRFPTLLFWVHATPNALEGRLNSRVDSMVASGLLDEVKTLNSFSEHQAERVDETRGIWVSIGYKEFKEYSNALRSGATDTELARLRNEAIERTKISTRQYAKRQLRWIRIKLVNALAQVHAQQNLFLLDGSNVSQFGTTVEMPAIDICRSFLNGDTVPNPTELSDLAAEMLTAKRDYDLSSVPEQWVKQYCAVCSVTCVTADQWQMHLKSKAHRKRTRKKDVPWNATRSPGDGE